MVTGMSQPVSLDDAVPPGVAVPDHRFGLGLLAVVIFGAGALFAQNNHVPSWDQLLTTRLAHPRGSSAFRLADAVSTLASGPVIAALAVGFAIATWRRSRNLLMAALVPVAGALGGVAELAAKHVVGRLRPPTAVLTGESGNGFPSGHTTGATAVAFAIVAMLAALGFSGRRLAIAWCVAIVASVMVAVARVVVGAHYLLDTIGGLALGSLCALVAAVVLSAAPASHLVEHWRHRS